MRYVIIGGGAAGVAAAQTLRRLDSAGQITIISGEDRVGYYRPVIPHLISDKFPEDRFNRATGSLADLRADIISPVKAQSIDTRQKIVKLPQKDIPYDRLLLATGSQAIVPTIKGLKSEDLFTLRSYTDGVKLARAAKAGLQTIIIGGGRVGIKAALALCEAGLKVTVVEMLGHILPQQFDATAAVIIAPALEAKDIQLQTGRQVKEVTYHDKKRKVILDNGQELPCDLIVAAVGVRPNLELAQQMGVKVDKGVIVDSNLQTSISDVFAAGDTVQLVDLATGQSFVSGTWTNAVDMGNCAASNMAGAPQKYAGSMSIYNAVEIGDIPTISVGAIHGQAPLYEVHAHRWGNIYHKFVFQGNRLVGMLLITDIEKAGIYKTLIREGADVSRIKGKIISKTLNYATFLKQLTPETKQYARM